MRIAVLVKYVPDIHAERQIVEGRLVRSPAEGTLNELDENAVEAALHLVESLPDGERADSEIVAVTAAPSGADAALRKTFQLGIDRAVRVTDDAIAGSDYFGTVAVLTAALRRLDAERPVDLVICGMASLDGLGSVVPTLLGAELDWPALTLADVLHCDASASAGTATVTRDVDEVTETLTAPLPAIVSVTDRLNDPRMPNFQFIMAARRKPIEVWDLADIGVDPASVGQAGARLVVNSAVPRPPRPPVEIVTDKGQGGTALAEFLIRNELV